MLSLNNFPIICFPSESVLDFSHARLWIKGIRAAEHVYVNLSFFRISVGAEMRLGKHKHTRRAKRLKLNKRSSSDSKMARFSNSVHFLLKISRGFNHDTTKGSYNMVIHFTNETIFLKYIFEG